MARGSSGERLVVSRFVSVSWSGGQVEVLSPRTRVTIRTGDPRLVRLLDRCATPQPRSRLGSSPEARELVDKLVEAAVLVPEGEEDREGGALRFWEAQDLAFHVRTRSDPGTFYRFLGKLPDEPRFREPGPGRPRKLSAAPDGPSPSFFEVLERRRTCRHFADRPLPLDALGRLLNGAAENLSTIPIPELGTEAVERPYPTSGGRAPLEIYVLVGDGRCDRLEAGLYRYLPSRRALEFVAKPGRPGQRLLRFAALATQLKGKGWVLLCFTARMARLGWKYERTAYASALKEVGCLMQTVYVTATALGLGCGSVGGGPFEALPKLTGIDWFTEAPVGEMTLGLPASRP